MKFNILIWQKKHGEKYMEINSQDDKEILRS